MSNISTAFDDFKTLVETILPDHDQLPNPYNIEENSELTLRQGYGIQLERGENTNRNISCRYSIQRDIILVITRKFYELDLIAEGKETTEKQLLEDLHLMIKEVEANETIGSSAITNIFYSSDNGIESVFTDKGQFLKVEITFQIEYLEEL